ncbi:hypothetical protein JTE90_006710 [Oedothorax gibbosus]|uniref:Nephrin n=1 Tax=Oedothorax gibbosus TaxID=931172 RepID=A0AAV6UK38_9ARAC|nr:hypothetical protein JTE90_006710 [Oedothorax gibbosus]
MVKYDPSVVEAVLGGQAAIPCLVPSPLSSDEASLILWYRIGTPNPIYTLDARQVRMDEARHFPSDEAAGRAHFNTSVHPPVLVLEDVVARDEADYKCRVDLRRSRTLILHTRLRVIVPPSDPIIMDEHGQWLHDVVGPYDEGSAVKFICEVDGGDPSPNVTWWRGAALYDDDFNVIKRRFVRNEIFLERVTRSDLMAEYTCKASNTPLAKPKTATIQLDLNLLPIQAKILGLPTVLLGGEENELTCETRGSRPRAYTTWWLDGRKMTSTDVTREGGNVTYSTLLFTPKPEDNGKRLLCKSVNPSIPKVAVEDERMLRVQYAPIVNLSLGTSSSQLGIREGSDVYLECRIWANPWIFEIAWQFEDRPLVANLTSGIIILNQSLILQSVRKEHRGRYRCMGANRVGHGYSNYLQLHVQFSPVCKYRHPKFHGISISETLNVTCDAEADPEDVVYRWSFNSSRQGTSWLDSEQRVLAFSPKGEHGYGTLMCWGKNSLGSQREPCVIRIVPAGAPTSPHDCLVTNQTSHSLTIECLPGYNGSLQQTFHMEVYNSVVEHMADNLTKYDRPKFLAVGLVPSTSYVLVIYASNVKGRSDSVALVAATLSAAERRTAQDDHSSLSAAIGILIAVVALLILLTAVVVVILIRAHLSKDQTTKDTVLSASAHE